MEQPEAKKCANCESKDFERVEGLYALTKIEKKDDKSLVFMPAAGIPLIVYVCKSCGELKIYPAMLFDELK